MTQTYAYGKLAWYPHLMPEDVAVWERFIAANPDRFDSCQYDVPVGSVPDFVKNDPSADMASMEKLYKLKIDVVGSRREALTIVELKPACTMSTLGQVKGYKHLYERDYSPPEEVGAMVICGAAKPDVLEYAKAEGVEVVIV